MVTYHVNPRTGSPSVCHATEKRGCPYEGVSEHFESKEEARVAYEKNQEKIWDYMRRTKIPLARDSVVLGVYNPMDEEVPHSSSSIIDPVAVKFFKMLDKSPHNSLLVVDDGTIFQKTGLWGSDSWRLRTKTSHVLGMKQHGAYSSAYILGHVKREGARLETPPKRFYPGVDYFEGVGKRVPADAEGLSQYSDAEFAKIYAKQYNDARESGDFVKLADFEVELVKRKGRQADFIVINTRDMKATPLRNLSAEGIDERRRDKGPGWA